MGSKDPLSPTEGLKVLKSRVGVTGFTEVPVVCIELHCGIKDSCGIRSMVAFIFHLHDLVRSSLMTYGRRAGPKGSIDLP